jgi:hypothetical protein
MQRSAAAFSIILAVAFLTAGFSSPRAATLSEANGARLLAGRASGETPLMDDLRELCDGVGGRITGSPACEKAVAWGVRKLEEAGVDRVWTEEFTIPSLWLPKSLEIACTSPARFTIDAVAAPFSPGASFTAPLVDAGSGRPEDFEALGSKARGAVALVATDPMDSIMALFGEYMRNRPMMEAAGKAGVRGLLVMSSRPRGLLYRHPISLVGRIASIPVAQVAREDGLRLHRLMERGPVEIRIAIDVVTGGPYQSRNVLAEIRGREKPEEVVLFGAHLDSWDLGTGAEDNGVNVATVIDVARGMKALGLAPRRSVRFALFTGEEQGMFGSAGYVKTHADELSSHVVAIIHDTGSGRINGYYLSGREELRAPLETALAAVSGLGPFTHTTEAIDGTDNFDFLLSGVPNLVADQEAAPYLPDYHASSDNFDIVDGRQARINGSIAAAVVWHFAEMAEPPATRQSREDVQKLLESSGLTEVMESFEQYEGWIGGERGAHP